jgi:hypothetical protein
MDSFITYDGLPIKSGGAHSLGRMNIDETLRMTSDFLKRFTNADKPIEVNLSFYQSPTREYKTTMINWLIRKKFGYFPRCRIGYLKGIKIKYWIWELSSKKVDKGLDFLRNYNFKADQELGPIEISFKWTFKFKSPNTNELFPNQNELPQLDIRQKNSQLYLKLSNRSTMSTWFAFPFPEVDDNFIKLLTEMQNTLPFKFSEKHWRIWKKSKNNNWTSKKIVINAG